MKSFGLILVIIIGNLLNPVFLASNIHYVAAQGRQEPRGLSDNGLSLNRQLFPDYNSTGYSSYELYSDVTNLTNEPILVYECQDDIIDLAVSGDGRYVVFICGDDFMVFDTVSKAMTTIHTVTDYYFDDVDISDTGYIAAAVSYGTGMLVVVNVSSGEKYTHTFTDYSPEYIDISYDGRYIAFIGDSVGVYEYGVGIKWVNSSIYGDFIEISGDGSRTFAASSTYFAVFNTANGSVIYYNEEITYSVDELKADYYGNVWIFDMSSDQVIYLSKDNYDSVNVIYSETDN